MELSEIPDYIRANLQFGEEEITIAKVSKLCYMSTSSFKNHFKAQFGEPLRSYIIRIRMYVAADLLTSGKMNTIKDISELVGYNLPSNFTAVFKEFYGYVPEEIFIRKEKYMNGASKVNKQSDWYLVAERVLSCPEQLKKDFEAHFGRPIMSFIYK